MSDDATTVDATDERPQPTLEALRERLLVERQGEKRRGLYAGLPSTGPDGKTCRTCAHKRYTGKSKPRSHPKCGLTNYTAGDATTIRTSTPACHRYQDAT